MNERICRFGPENALLGVLSDAGSTANPDLPTAVVLNAGLLHHVGQNRMSVLLARQLARRGYDSFRFDFSGIGDSRQRSDAASVRERNVAEVRLAMDYLEKTRGARKFVLIGLCTGADNAHRAAVADQRVQGMVMLDGYSYPTPRYLMRRFGSKVLRPTHWLGFASARVKRALQRLRNSGSEMADSDFYFWVLPKKTEVESELSTLVDRGVHMLQVFSGNKIAYNYRDQYVDSFKDIDFKGLLHVHHAEAADHTYSIKAHREELFTLITGWFETAFPNVDSVPASKTA